MRTTTADRYFSLYIRLRDCDENRLAKCCTCGKIVDVKYADNSHFIGRQHKNTRFDEMNCHTACKKCNGFEEGRKDVYEKFLIDRYGQYQVHLLKAAGRMSIRHGAYELKAIAGHYKQKATDLAKQKGIELW